MQPESPLQIDPARLRVAARIAVIGLFALGLGAFLFFARSLVLPVVAAAIISTMFGPLAAKAAQYRIPAIVFALVCTGAVLMVINLLLILVGGMVADWAARMPEIASALHEKANLFERPLSAWRELQATLASALGTTAEPPKFEIPARDVLGHVVEFLTPAIGELVVFFGMLFFFLLSRNRHRQFLVLMFEGQEARLEALRILNDIEATLTRYIALVTVINIGVGVVVALTAYAFGLPTPLKWGVVAFLLNYIPYLGPAVVVTIFLILGLVTQSTLLGALGPPALFVAFATLEGNFITPSIIGQQLTLNPLAVFLSLAFWTWLWGPLGTLLATPILIAIVVVYAHVSEPEELNLPG